MSEKTTEPTRMRTLLRWAPVTLALVLAASGGIAMLTAPLGHEADHAQVKELVVQAQEKADAAEQVMFDEWARVLDHASGADAQDVVFARAVPMSLLGSLLDSEAETKRAFAEHTVDETSAATLRAAFEGQSGYLAGVEIVPTTSTRTTQSYLVTFQLDNADGDYERSGVFEYTVDAKGSVTDATLTWDAAEPQRS